MRFRLNIFFFLIIVSILPIVGLTWLIFHSFDNLQEHMTEEAKALIRADLEHNVESKSKDIGRQLEVYISDHPEMTIQDLQNDQVFRQIAVQTVAQTGYTAVHNREGVNLFHPDPKIENRNLTHDPSLPYDFKLLFNRSLGGEPVAGYYTWPDGKRNREKYMALRPLRGTDLIIATTVYTDLFFDPALESEERITSTWTRLRIQVIALAGIAVMVVMIVGQILITGLTRPIKPLISGMKAFTAGNLSYRIRERGKGEFATLAGVFNSMAAKLETQTEQLAERTRKAEHSEESLRLLLENIYSLIVYVGMDGRIMRASPLSAEVLGYPPDEMVGRHYSELVDMGSIKRVVAPFAFSGEPLHRQTQFLLRAKHLGKFWVDLQVSPVLFFEPDIGEVAMMVCRDISKEKRLEQTIQLLSKSVDQAMEGIALLDLQGIFLYVNRKWVELYGLSRPEELIGKSYSALPVKADREGSDRIEHLLKTRTDWNKESILSRRDGTEFPVHLSASMVREEDGTPIAMMAVISDISQRKELERKLKRYSEDLEQQVRSRTEQLAETNEQLEEAMKKVLELDRLKSDFLAHVSHQLRTPLNSIIGFSKLLQTAKDMQPQQMEDIDRIYQESMSLLRLIDSIIAMASIEAGRTELEPTRFDLAEAVRFVIESLTGEAKRKQIEMVDLVSGRDIEIVADRKKLNQILYSILDNAVRFSDKGEIVIGVRQAQENITLSIKDNGPGISEDNLENVFDRFAGTPENGGMGLGLPLARAFAEMHGGKVWVESTLGEGSTFFIQLPDLTGSA